MTAIRRAGGMLLLSMAATSSLAYVEGTFDGQRPELFPVPTAVRWDKSFPVAKNADGPERFDLHFGCYDALSGAPLPCQFKYRVFPYAGPRDPVLFPSGAPDGVHISGGHTHDDATRPMIFPDNNTGRLRYYDDGIEITAQPVFIPITGSTENSRRHVIQHPIPHVAGAISVQFDLIAPPRYFFDPLCFPANQETFRFPIIGEVCTQSRHNFTLYVGRRGLVQMPKRTDDYLVVRNPDSKHSDDDASYLSPQAAEALNNVAMRYKQITTRRLSVNDMSLPRGGTFDYKGRWVQPHQTHQAGKDADINRRDVGGNEIACLADYNLRRAVKNALGLKNPEGPDSISNSYLHCEEGGLKHINLDG